MGVPLILSSVPNINPYIQYVATNGQVVFPYPFPITQDSDLVAVVNGVTLATDNGYALSGQGQSGGGNLTFNSGQTTGTIVTLYRNIAIQRITQIGQNSGYSSMVFNAEFNNIYLILQQLQESFGFTLQVPNTNSPTPATTLLPSAYANKYLAFDANGNPTPAVLTSSGSLTAAVVNALLQNAGTVTAAETTLGVTPVNFLFPEGTVDRYANNAVPGTTNMLTAITTAFNVIVQRGSGTVTFLPAQYNVGTLNSPGPNPLATITGLTNANVNGNGAQIVCQTTFASALGAPRIFDCVNWENVTIDNVWANDSGFDITQTWKGAQLFMFTMSDATDRKRITVQNCRFKNLVTAIGFWTQGGGTGRYRGIKITGCVFDTCYNGPSFQELGDEVECDVTLINCLRNYFPYGCYGHNARLHIWHDSTSTGANACIDIKRYVNDTRNMRIAADFHGFVNQFGSLVNFETQMVAGTAAITSLGAITGGGSGADATYFGVPLTGGTGTGATANITVKGGVVTAVQMANRGKNYAANDTLSAASGNIGGCVGFSVVVATVGAVIDGVDIDLDLTDAQLPNGIQYTNPIQFRSLTTGGAVNNPTTDLWDRIALRGKGWNQVSLQPIAVLSVMGGPIGRISIDPALYDVNPIVPSATTGDLPSFILKLANDTERYCLLGNLTTAPLGIDLSAYALRFFSLIVDVHAESDYSFASNQTAQSFIVLGSVSAAGVVSLASSTGIYAAQVSGGTSAVPTIGATGTKLTVSFSNYNGANARARVTVRHLARLR